MPSLPLGLAAKTGLSTHKGVSQAGASGAISDGVASSDEIIKKPPKSPDLTPNP